MKKLLFCLVPVLAITACNKSGTGIICTQELRMITLKVMTPAKSPVSLDSAYTIRVSNNERINYQHQMSVGTYVVLDDSYHHRLRRHEDQFRFIGWKNNQVVVNELYRIAGDQCHINKRSGADSVIVQ